MNKTKIEWTDYTWNPVTGCHKVSRGCKHCYAETLTKRFGKAWGKQSFRDVQIHEERLIEPLEMGEKLHGKRVFVCDMSDLFHKDVPFEFIAKVFAVMALCPLTTFQVLTKQPGRAIEYFKKYEYFGLPDDRELEEIVCGQFDHLLYDKETHQLSDYLKKAGWFWDNYKTEFGNESNLIFENNAPIKNIWIGTSCEDQATANERIPLLLQIPAAVHFLSCEPLLEKIDLDEWLNECGGSAIDWVIAGGESGRGAQPLHPDWVRSLRNQCKAAKVPFFFKQWGEYLPYEPVQPPYYRNCATTMEYDGHIMNHIDPETSEAGKFDGHRWFDPMDAITLCLETNSPDCTFLRMGKSNTLNFLDGKQHLEFPNEIPGHGPEGSFGQERRSNPYVRDLQF